MKGKNWLIFRYPTLDKFDTQEMVAFFSSVEKKLTNNKSIKIVIDLIQENQSNQILTEKCILTYQAF
jgi:cell fate (sporulation/competence/biofilm development) regulator YmcA (YheA/YmcA/DUF963 family)